ncbi:MAG: class I SAM-dependent methyltransferase [Phycisphaerales bacterium]|nr:class I SAM-dependent methyltransferase [Phycisphaerales bacterium]
MKTPLHQQQPTTRFSDRAADYVRFRPTYPAEAIDAVLAGLGEPGTLGAADIGAGTGISARLLAERGVRVFAVEPNGAMRDAGRAETGSSVAPPCCEARGILWVDGTAESTTLPGASVDLVLCAQSYHWFEPGAACREFARILRPGGRLALLWNDGDETTPVARGYYDLVRGASTGAGPSSHQTVAKAPPIAPPFDGASMRRLVFRNEQRLDADGLIGRAMSASYVVKEGPRAVELLDGLRRLHAAHAGPDGRVGLVYAVWLYLLDRP